MTVHVIKAPAGLGKTSLILDKLPALAHKRVEIYVPTLDLANEIHAKLSNSQVTSKIVMGREQPDGAGQSMCRKPTLAREISKLGYPVFPIICMGRTVPRDKYSAECCEYFRECSYLKQFETNEQILIYTHAYLPLPRNNKETIRPSLVVIDESFLSTCLESYSFPRGELRAAVHDDSKRNAKNVVNRVLTEFDEDRPILDALRAWDLSAETMKRALDEVSSSGASFNPYSSDAELLTGLKTFSARMRVDILIEVLIAEVKTPRSQSHGITFNHNAQILTVHYRKPISRFQSPGTESDIIIIDANADIELIRPWFPDARFQDIPALRKAHVIQCSSMRGSISSFVPNLHKDDYSRKWAEKNLEGIEELISRESQGGAKKLLIVGPQIVTGNSNKAIEPLISCPPNGVLAHFNGLRGVDAYKSFDGIIVIGRNQPPIEELEKLARSLWFDADEPLRFANDWVVELRPHRMRDPAHAIGVEVLIHPDPRIQKLHEQIREGESTQAIDRLRLIHTLQPKRVIVVSNIPLDIVVDELITFDELAWQSRFQQAINELDGILPLNSEFLSGRFPYLWATPSAAKMDLRRGRKKGQIVNSIFINNSSLLNYEYRVRGQRRHSRALSVFPPNLTHSALMRHLGHPVILRSIVDGIAGDEIFGAMGAAQFPALIGSGVGGSIISARAGVDNGRKISGERH